MKYYVLWQKNSALLKEYLEKYYKRLISHLEKLRNNWILSEEIEELLIVENRDFILNPDQSGIINFLIINDLDSEEFYAIEQQKLKNEINIYLEEWIGSKNLCMNQWQKISWTNVRLTAKDNNPYNIFEAHPDHHTTWWILWWWERWEEEWLWVYEKTFRLLQQIDEWTYDELNQIIQKIVPLGTAKSIHNSASYNECIGHIYLGYTINSSCPEINNLEAIIHESSHNKLNLLLQFDPIILNNKDEKYYSAIRPDARHIYGVFLGYHAFAPTMYIIMKAYKNGYLWENMMWLEKIVLYHIKTKFLQKVIKKYAKLTKLWEEISQEIDYVILWMDTLMKELNPSSEVIIRAKKRQIEHFKQVNKNYPNLEY